MFEYFPPLKAPIDTTLCVYFQDRVSVMPLELIPFEYHYSTNQRIMQSIYRNKYSTIRKFKHLYKTEYLWHQTPNILQTIQGDPDSFKVSTILSATKEVSSRYLPNWSSLQSAFAHSPSGSSGVHGQ
jgi:hypothetical protein